DLTPTEFAAPPHRRGWMRCNRQATNVHPILALRSWIPASAFSSVAPSLLQSPPTVELLAVIQSSSGDGHYEVNTLSDLRGVAGSRTGHGLGAHRPRPGRSAIDRRQPVDAKDHRLRGNDSGLQCRRDDRAPRLGDADRPLLNREARLQ